MQSLVQRVGAGLAVALLSLAAAEPALAQRSTTVPAPFLGAWVRAEDPERCGDNAYDSGLTLERRMVLFYESGGDVRRIRWLDRRTVRIAVTSTDIEDGARSSGSYTFRLSPDGRRLTELSRGANTAYVRCPSR
jgi:hypothetical protein